jgi:hypothetical protein
MAQDVQAFARDFVTPDLAHWYREGWAMLQTKYQPTWTAPSDWMLVLAMAERKGADLGKIAAVVAQTPPAWPTGSTTSRLPGSDRGEGRCLLEAKAGGEKWRTCGHATERAQPYMGSS